MAVNRHSMRAAQAIVIHCPCDAAALNALRLGEFAALDRDPVVGRMLAIIRGHRGLGDFGSYKAVVEISVGVESFTATAQARPTLGQVEQLTLSPTIILTTYVDEHLPADALNVALAALMDAHPWEVPVIEVRSTQLLMRQSPRD